MSPSGKAVVAEVQSATFPRSRDLGNCAKMPIFCSKSGYGLPLNDQKGQFLGRRIRLIGGEFIGTAGVCSGLS